VSENYSNDGALGAGNETQAGSACRGVSTFTAAANVGNVASLTCNAGVLSITMGAKAKGVALTLTPTAAVGSADALTWLCEVGAQNQNKYVPAECRGT
jgi:hypothetical protein